MNNVTAPKYVPYSNHKELYTNLSIGFGVFCFLSCIALSYKRYFKTKKRKFNKNSKFIPRKKQKTTIETLDPSIKDNYLHHKSFITSQLEFYGSKLLNIKNPVREKNMDHSNEGNEKHHSSDNSNHKELAIQSGDDAWEMVEKQVPSSRR